MIYPQDANEFSDIMDATWQSLARNVVDKPTKKFWFDKFLNHSVMEVGEAFDKYLMTGTKDLPHINDILKILKPKDDFYKALPKPANSEEVNAAGLKKLEQVIATNLKPKTDYHAWFKRILRAPWNFPDSSVQEARRVALDFGYDVSELEATA